LEGLYGKERYACCWQHVQLPRLAVLVRRPLFLGPLGVPTKFNPKCSYVAIEAQAGSAEVHYTKMSWVHW
jgi:hypothetical protein